MKHSFFVLAGILAFLVSCTNDTCITSPSGDYSIMLRLDDNGQPQYSISANGNEVISWSPMGLEASEADLAGQFKITGVKTSKVDKVWEQPWGENKTVRDNHREIAVSMSNSEGVDLTVRMRAYDDGVAFRYEYETQEDSLTVLSEKTGFRFAQDGMSWSIPGNFETYELDVREQNISAVENANTPFTFATPGVYGSIHEAALYDFPEMNLYRCDALSFTAELAPRPDGCKARIPGCFTTPWRSFQLV